MRTACLSCFVCWRYSENVGPRVHPSTAPSHPLAAGCKYGGSGVPGTTADTTKALPPPPPPPVHPSTPPTFTLPPHHSWLQAANVVAAVCRRYSGDYQNIAPRVQKTLLKALQDPAKPLTTHYGEHLSFLFIFFMSFAAFGAEGPPKGPSRPTKPLTTRYCDLV